MKTRKSIALILAIFMIIAVFPAYSASAAAIGDKLGNVLNSDIKVFIDDNRIPSYNIANKTVIVAEDLRNYGFDVQWDSSSRSLYITLAPGKAITPIAAENNTKTPGTPAFPYVYTDIVAYVNGQRVESFNVQGKTVIYFADLAVYGTMKWDGTNRHSMFYSNSYTPVIKVGDVLGSVLNSNIKAFINDNRIPSYNIANKTVILAEDLRNYGFDVQWNQSTKSIYITLNTSKTATPLTAQDNTKTPGTRAFDYVYTDIVAYVNNKKVESFNIQGKTAIYFADLSEYGLMQWDGGNSHSKLYTLFKVSGKAAMSDNTSPSSVKVTLKERSGGKVISSTTTDSGGNYSFSNVQSGSYTLEFVRDGYKTQTVSTTVSKSDSTGLSTTLYRDGVTISGKIFQSGVTSSTAGLQGVTVNLRDSAGKIVSTMTTKNDGLYSFENITAGRYSVEAIKDGYESTATSLFNAEYLDIANKNLSMQYEGVTVSGTIYKDTNSAVFSGVTVNLKNSSGTVVDITKSSTNGTYSFTEVASGTYTVEAVSSGYPEATTSSFNVQTTNITGKNLTIKTSGYTLSGTVYSSTTSNVTVSGATVKLKNTSGTQISSVTSQSNGTYTFNGVAAGTYVIEVSATGYTTTTSNYITVSGNKTQHVYFGAAGTITGTLTYQYYSGSTSITVTTSQGTYTFAINSSTSMSGFTNYAYNAPVTVGYTGTLGTNAVAVSISNSSIAGTVTGTLASQYYSGLSSITVVTSQGTYAFTVSSSTSMSGFTNYAYGSPVTVSYTGTLGTNAVAVSISNSSTTGTVTGTLASQYYSGSSSITVVTSQGTYAFTVNSSTSMSGFTNYAYGSPVTVSYTGTLGTNAVAISVSNSGITGTVTGTLASQYYSGSSSITVVTSQGTYAFTVNSSTNTTSFTNYSHNAPVAVSYTGTLGSNAVALSISSSGTSTGTVTGTLAYQYYSGSGGITVITPQGTYAFTINSSTNTSSFTNYSSGASVTVNYTGTLGSNAVASSISSSGTSTGTMTGTVSVYVSGSYITISTSQGGTQYFLIGSGASISGTVSVGSSVSISYYISNSTYYVSSISVTGTSGQQHYSITGTVTSVNEYTLAISTTTHGSLSFSVYHISNKPSNLAVGKNVTVYFSGYVTSGNTNNAAATSIIVNY